MRKIFTVFALLFVFYSINSAHCAPYFGQVERNAASSANTLIDSQTKTPVSGAKVSLPQKMMSTKTDKNGKFYLDAQVQGATIMNIEKNGYKPYSLTIDENTLSKPLVVGIEKSSTQELMLEDDLCHIGDNNFSMNSANASEFRIKSAGASFSRNFKIPVLKDNNEPVLIIGSIIGIDTLMAQKIGQSHAINAYASPPEVYFNGNKVAEIQINGDNQEIRLPIGLINQGRENNITIKAGRNLFQHDYTDYDDIEFMNLYIDYKPSTLAKY